MHEDDREIEIPPREDRSSRWRSRLAGAFGTAVVFLLGPTWRIRLVVPESVRRRLASREGTVFAFWHGQMLPLVHVHRRRGFVVLVSLHGDGDIIARIIHAMGFKTVRGSTTRGGRRALAALVDEGRRGASIGITPDGPRGPRQVLQPGLVALAARSGIPVVLLAASARSAWRARSWDRFMVPLPFTRCAVVYSDPVVVPPDLGPDEFERTRSEFELRLMVLTAEADRLAGVRNVEAK